MLTSLYKQVSSAIDAQSVAREMFQCNALTARELHSIQFKKNEPIKAGEQLVNYVMKQSKSGFCCFLDALKNTGHHDVSEIIVSRNYKGSHDVYTSIL